MRLLVLCCSSALLSGCFTWRPVTGAPPLSSEVEATLSDPGTARLTSQIGPNAGTLLGRVTSVRGDSIDLALAEVRTRNGLTYYLVGTTVVLVREDLAMLRHRELDKRRTAIAVTAGVLGAAALASGVHAIGGGSDNTGGGGGGPPAARPPR